MMSFVRSVLHRMKKGKEERKATNWDDEDLLIVIIFFIDSDKHHLGLVSCKMMKIIIHSRDGSSSSECDS